MCTHKIVHIIRIPVPNIISSKRARSTFKIPKELEIKEVQGSLGTLKFEQFDDKSCMYATSI
jgi:hypothetical protein